MADFMKMRIINENIESFSDDVSDFLFEYANSSLYDVDGTLQYFFISTDKRTRDIILKEANERFSEDSSKLDEIKDFMNDFLIPASDEGETDVMISIL